MTLAFFFLPPSNTTAWEMLKGIWGPHLWILLAALFLSLILTPICRTIAVRYGIYDLPDERLKTHRAPIPYLGGVAIFLSWAIPVLAVAVYQSFRHDVVPGDTQRAIELARGSAPDKWPVWIDEPAKIFWIVGAALLMLLLGLLDDLKDVKPRVKIAGQVLAALMLVAGGMVFSAFPEGLSEDLGGWSLFPTFAWWVVALGVVLQVMLVVGASNATNLLDGLDGLCSGVTGIISVGFMLLATSLLAWDLYQSHVVGGIHYANAEIIVLMSFALLGAVVGFLPYNFNPASIFMGDAGSMFLGFMAAVFMVLFAERPRSLKWFLGAMVIFGLPIFDTGLTLVRRLVNRKPVFAGDRSHFYDQLVDRGCTAQKSVVINYGLALFFAAAGVGIIFLRLRYALPVYFLIFAAMTAMAIKRGYIRSGPPTNGPATKQ